MAYNEENSTNGELIKVKAYYAYCLFPRLPAELGVGDNTFGITKWEVLEAIEGSPKEDRDGQITITGEFVEPLERGKPYVILAKRTEHPKYGPQYNLLYINQQVDLKKLNNQKAFLKSFLTDGQIAEMYKIYEDPLAVIEAHDIEGLKR